MGQDFQRIFLEFKRYCRRAYDKGLSCSSCGNLSARLNKRVFMITSSGASLSGIIPSEISICEIDTGKLIKGKKPSMEMKMHQQLYKIKDDIKAIFHSHPIFTSIIACSNIDLYNESRFVLPETIAHLGPISRLRYFPAGSLALARAVSAKADGINILILSNHGLLCMGNSLKEVLDKTELVEFLSQLICEAKSLGIKLNLAK